VNADIFEGKEERERTGDDTLARFMRSQAVAIVNLVNYNHRSSSKNLGKKYPNHRQQGMARLVRGEGTT
jgi:hypothetical protein